LHGRGLFSGEASTATLARQLGYATIGKGRAAAVQDVIREGLEHHLPQVPGLFVQSKDGRSYWTISGTGGLAIPVRDERKRLVAVSVGADAPKGGAKYLWLSSKKRGGAGPGALLPCPAVWRADRHRARHRRSPQGRSGHPPRQDADHWCARRRELPVVLR